MAIKVTCEKCGASFTTDETNAGKKTACPTCSNEILIPTEDDLAFREDLEQLARLGTRLDAESVSEQEEGSAATPEPQPAAEAADDTTPEFEVEEPAEAQEPEPAPEPVPIEERPAPTMEAAQPAEEQPEEVQESPPPTAEVPKPKAQPTTEAPAAPGGGQRRLLKAMTLIIVFCIAFALIECFQVVRGVTEARPQGVTLHSLTEGMVIRAKNLTARIGNVAREASRRLVAPSEQEPAVPAPITTPWRRLDRLAFAGALMLLALRLLFKTKVLESIYLGSPSALEHSPASLIVNFGILVMLVAGVAGSAALAKLGSQALACTSVAVLLLASAVWLLVLHYWEHGAHPHVAGWGINNALSGLLIVVVVALIPDTGIGQRLPTSRGAVTVMLLLLNSAVAFAIGSRFVFESERAGRAWRRIGFLVMSFLLVAVIGSVLVLQG